MEETVFLIRENGDTEKLTQTPRRQRAWHLDCSADSASCAQPPRIVKTHLLPSFLERQVKQDKVKVIVIVRNPKDTLVSFFHFYRMHEALGNFTGSWDQFFEAFKNRELIFHDYFEMYSQWWPLRTEENVLFVHYEECKSKPVHVVKEIGEFLGKELSDDTAEKIALSISFKNMKHNPVNIEALCRKPSPA